MSARDLTRSEIVALLEDLGSDLDARGLRAELFAVGGAAMALAYNTRRTTRDIYGVFEPKAEVYEAAARVGGRHGLSEAGLGSAPPPAAEVPVPD
ncbi:MAG: hypothetical protein ACOYY2_15650 [Actinomycetota bacterium]